LPKCWRTPLSQADIEYGGAELICAKLKLEECMRVKSRGFEIAYQSVGEAPTAILMISGQLQAAEDWLDAGYARMLVPAYRVIAIDPLGYGDSDKPHNPDVYGLDGKAADVEAVLDDAGVDRSVIWAYSMGVPLAEAFVKQHPERTEAVVLGGCLVGLSPKDRNNIFIPAAPILEHAGLARYIDETMPFLGERVRDLFLCRNDPLAAAASSRAYAIPYAAEDTPLPDATLNYAGTREPWYEIAVAVAEANGVAFESVPDADHGHAFRAAATVVPMVLSFLASL
jgi:pimeloyl-ACP methyl ester carboxylesterase